MVVLGLFIHFGYSMACRLKNLLLQLTLLVILFIK